MATHAAAGAVPVHLRADLFLGRHRARHPCPKRLASGDSRPGVLADASRVASGCCPGRPWAAADVAQGDAGGGARLLHDRWRGRFGVRGFAAVHAGLQHRGPGDWRRVVHGGLHRRRRAPVPTTPGCAGRRTAGAVRHVVGGKRALVRVAQWSLWLARGAGFAARPVCRTGLAGLGRPPGSACAGRALGPAYRNADHAGPSVDALGTGSGVDRRPSGVGVIRDGWTSHPPTWLRLELRPRCGRCHGDRQRPGAVGLRRLGRRPGRTLQPQGGAGRQRPGCGDPAGRAAWPGREGVRPVSLAHGPGLRRHGRQAAGAGRTCRQGWPCRDGVRLAVRRLRIGQFPGAAGQRCIRYARGTGRFRRLCDRRLVVGARRSLNWR